MASPVLLPREVCGISFFYVVKYDKPYNSEKEEYMRDDLNMWFEIDAPDELVEIEHNWPFGTHTIQIAARYVSYVVRDLDEMNELFRALIHKAGYVISEPIGDANGSSK